MTVRTSHFLPARIFPVLLILATLVAVTMSAALAHAGQAALTWKAPTTYEDGTAATQIGGYKVRYGTSPGNYTQSLDVGNVTSHTVTGLTDGVPYYFAVMAYDAAGTESSLSNEMTKASAATYSITATAGAGGSITAQGTTANQATNGTSTISTVSVAQGASQSFTITPQAGYSIAQVTVDGAAKGAVSTYTFSSVAANHSIEATFTPSATPQPSTGSPAFIVNTGGGAYTSSSGVTYKADAAYSGGKIGTTAAVIAGTADSALYQNERFGNFSYAAPLANGNYTVTLKFAEIYWTAPGKRIFSVTMNGKTVLSNVDIFAKVGKNNAYDVDVPVSVTNGMLNIGFVTQQDNATVSAIAVTPATSASTPVATPATPAGTAIFAANTGGQQLTASGGTTYAADSRFTGGRIGTTAAAIAGTTDSALYQTERFGNFTYSIPVANGNYAVILNFAEIYWTAPGRRIFSVAINGNTVIDRLDIFAKVGKNRSHDVQIPVTVTNGTINVAFTSHVDNATLGAILVKTM